MILMYSQFLTPVHVGGTEQSTSELAIILQARGNVVHILTSDSDSNGVREAHKGITIHRLNGFGGHRIYGVAIQTLSAVALLAKVKPDVVLCKSFSSSWTLALACRLMSIPYICWGQGSDIYSEYPFKKALLFLTISLSSGAIFLSEDMRKASGVIVRRYAVISNGIDYERFNAIDRNDARIALGIEMNERVLLFVGRLIREKGVATFLRATKTLIAEGKLTKCIIAGDGPARKELEELANDLGIREFVQFLGRQPYARIPIIMKAADVMVLPSQSEGQGRVLIEAMASGLPVVASAVGGIPETVENNQNGFLVEPDNPNQIVEKVSILLSDKAEYERISRNNKQRAASYDWEFIEKMIGDFIEDVSHCEIKRPG